MTKTELRGALGLALVVGLRIFGLFLVLPVLALDLARMAGVTPWLIGLALGVYGVGHLFLQVPLGLLSDRIGRKPVITLGLSLFALGSLVAALATGVWGIILGRALQGTGAVTGASQALAADLTRDEDRNAVMGILGGMVGLAFLLALLLGSTFAAHLGGLNGLFGLTFVLVLLAIVALWLLVPHAPVPRAHGSAGASAIIRTLTDVRLRVMDLSAFILHGLLMLLFVAMPLRLAHDLHLEVAEQWHVYVPALLSAGLVMGAALPRMRSHAATVRAAQISVLLLVVGLGLLAEGQSSLAMVVIGSICFFVAFSLLEASLPSLVSRLVPVSQRGAALGAYSASQFLGVIVGGVIGGLLLGSLGTTGVFTAAAAAALVWLVVLLWQGRRLHSQPDSSRFGDT